MTSLSKPRRKNKSLLISHNHLKMLLSHKNRRNLIYSILLRKRIKRRRRRKIRKNRKRKIRNKRKRKPKKMRKKM